MYKLYNKNGHEYGYNSKIYKIIDSITGSYNNAISLCSNGNFLYKLTVLPKSLEILYCERNNLIIIPKLPKTLQLLHCNYNRLIELPELPQSLITLNCETNHLSTLPTLPNSLTILSCRNNIIVVCL